MSEIISETEAQELLGKLDSWMREEIPDNIPIGPPGINGDWTDPLTVLDLIQAEIAEGRPVIRKIRVADGGPDKLTGRPRPSQGSSAELTGSEPYTAVEQLSLTSEALALAFISPVQMASKLMSTLSKFGAVDAEEISINFAAAKELMPEPAMELDLETIERARSVAEPLANELRKLSSGLGETAREMSMRPENTHAN
jgi:hypothetical protein